MDDQELVANLDYFCVFFSNTTNLSYSWIVSLYCYIWFLLSSILDLCLFHMPMHIKSIDCILLLLLTLKTILLTSSVNTFRFLHLNLYSDFNNNLLFFLNFLWFPLLWYSLCFSTWFILFLSWAASKRCLCLFLSFSSLSFHYRFGLNTAISVMLQWLFPLIHLALIQ